MAAGDDEREAPPFDEELHLLSMQMQKYQYKRLTAGEIWIIWYVGRVLVLGHTH